MQTTKMRKWVGALALVAVGCVGLTGCQSAPPQEKAPEPVVPAGKITFEDAVKIDNGVVRLAVSPSVGRVVEFGYVGQPNLLWVNTQDIFDTPPGPDTYYNIGGDKLWVAPQPLWKNAFGHDNWPPEGVIDGAAWTLVEQKRDSITIQSPESPDYGVVVRRTFQLPASKSQAVITNQIVRLRANPHPLQLWTVTQIKEPDTAVLDIAKDGPEMPTPFVKMTDETPVKVEGYVRLIGEGGAVAWTQQGDVHAKLGTLGRWVAGVYDGVVFRQSTKFDANAAYPEASSVQVYRAGDYTELELLSPLIQLAPGESMSNTVTWALIEVSKQYDPTDFLLASDPK
ncbi:DUF4380 domain-containing protein [Algisphaera agarilytica]|uniref:DUF4380 domain-containing protein n=1 Tax=Algisphaera agarilytica TaxID=1385975 RepID=A0A7X0HAU5_9BACT|nr:DUF4380 domain-containing protein [Algisphaera agarilytica]MBB6431316.1 hypothetical protein [Algisphaera agarilytica]